MNNQSNDSKKKKLNQPVAMILGAGALDVTDIVNAQDSEYETIEDQDDTISEPLSLTEEAQLLKEEFDTDPELQKDVLADFQESESNENLEKLAASIAIQEKEQLAHYENLVDEVTAEMKDMNNLFIAEDKMLESSLLTAEKDEVEVEDLSEQDQELLAALPQANEDGSYDLEDLQSCISALLFYSDRPISLKKIKDMLEMPEADDAPLMAAIDHLKIVFADAIHGFEIADIAGGYQLRTKITKAPLLRKLAKVQVQRLSRGAMETLTIVAYKQPCTKDDIDKVRGVDSSHFIRTLLDRKLIEVTGRAEAMGRPMVYATTDTYLEVFGLMDLKAMPPLHEIEAMVPQLVAVEEGAEDPRVIQMRKMVQQMKSEANSLDYSTKEDEHLLQEIRDRVKSIEISTPFLIAQKELEGQGLSAEEILAHQLALQQPTPVEQPDLLT